MMPPESTLPDSIEMQIDSIQVLTRREEEKEEETTTDLAAAKGSELDTRVSLHTTKETKEEMEGAGIATTTGTEKKKECRFLKADPQAYAAYMREANDRVIHLDPNQPSVSFIAHTAHFSLSNHPAPDVYLDSVQLSTCFISDLDFQTSNLFRQE